MADNESRDELAGTLITVRDWLRRATSRFAAAGLVYGHGTASALDEAAFIILETLRLPIDDLAPWLDARLTRAERLALHDVIERRIETRLPAPYLVGAAYIQGRRFRVDPRVIVPRSYIGELLTTGGLDPVLPRDVRRVLDLCTGSGCLAVLAAEAFPEAAVDGCDLSADALAVAALNVADHSVGDRVRLHQGDLFAAIGGERYDLILANPPYVAAAEVEAFAPEYAAEPRMAHVGGTDGLDLVHRILTEAPRHLEPRGVLVMEIGTGQAFIEARYPDAPFTWLDTEGSGGEVLAISAADLAHLVGRPPQRTRRRR